MGDSIEELINDLPDGFLDLSTSNGRVYPPSEALHEAIQKFLDMSSLKPPWRNPEEYRTEDNGSSRSSEEISNDFNELLNTMMVAHEVDRVYLEKRRRVQQIRKMLSDMLPDAYLYELYDDFIIIAHEHLHGFIRLTYTYDSQSVAILASEQEVVEQRLIKKKDGRMLRRWCRPDEEEPPDTLWFHVL